MKRITILLLLALFLCSCAAPAASDTVQTEPNPAVQTQTLPEKWADCVPCDRLALQYAEKFSVDFYPAGLSLITMDDGSRYLVIPQGGPVPAGIEADIVVLQQPLDKIYMASTSAMDLYRAVGALGNIRMSSQEASGWYIPEAAEAMNRGQILYAGKYNTPDYELLCSEGCNLAVENSMIYHSPEIREMLMALDIPVLVERSSFEPHPLGRLEWMKLHGLLTGRLSEAESCYNEMLEKLSPVLGRESTGKTVAFFSVGSGNTITVRKSSDYIVQTILLAGGEYVFADLGDSSQSTVNVDMEAFYSAACNADVLIYSGSKGEIKSMAELLELCAPLEDFRAVQNGNVWCTSQGLFQASTGIGDFLMDIHAILTSDAPNTLELTYLRQLK